MLFVLFSVVLFSVAQCYLISTCNNYRRMFSVKFKEYTLTLFNSLHSWIAFNAQKSVFGLQWKRMISNIVRCDKSSFRTWRGRQAWVLWQKKCRVPRIKFKCWFDKDFPTSDVFPSPKKRNDQFKRVFTSDLARELRGHVINLQMLSSGMME